ncbi:thiamine-phosphate pyrophosphorylase [Synechococcus sp. PCC 7502]|uniref:thiamine phosphate synthase n=1 Tax=Synechococcus sp. PCC 7502 TaxID=1173263 RepID=UPI00029FEF08|nr:thiamine phosphate synthase [Synechococcus sp. PCC 7502]AFY73402.1 thiamine-phosphate pyrophosphorylase [Synechococcus sp. PCC 7502]
MKTVYRILDANLDRAREGLRVIEEWCRFGLENANLTAQCKQLRQELGSWHQDEFKLARNTITDVGTAISHPLEIQREDVHGVLGANLARVQEALRVLEEYSKIDQPAMSAAIKQIRYQVYIIESALIGKRQKNLQKLNESLLYLVTMPSPNLLETVESCLKAGLSLVQYRDKDINDSERMAIATQLCELCHSYNALFLVNDRVDIALAVGADGVHLGQTDFPIAIARKLLGSDAIIGQSTTSPQELEIALNNDVDYVGVGPVFATPTKPGKAAAGFEYVSYAAQKLTIPWYAIGGIDADNLADVIKAGAKRVAVVRSLIQASSPNLTTQNLLNQLRSAT